jgi:hypothetical protein
MQVRDSRTTPLLQQSIVRRLLAATASPSPPATKEPPTSAEIYKQFLSRLEETRGLALVGGGKDRIAKQHAKGKLTARERIEVLADPGTFREYDQLVAHR